MTLFVDFYMCTYDTPQIIHIIILGLMILV